MVRGLGPSLTRRLTVEVFGTLGRGALGVAEHDVLRAMFSSYSWVTSPTLMPMCGEDLAVAWSMPLPPTSGSGDRRLARRDDEGDGIALGELGVGGPAPGG